jgi:hypothetical protein
MVIGLMEKRLLLGEAGKLKEGRSQISEGAELGLEPAAEMGCSAGLGEKLSPPCRWH